jgi:ABC-type transporter Mla subunit MlaD
MGDQISINGNFSNVVLNIKSTLTNVQQSVGAMSTVDETARTDLQHSIEQLSQALEQIPPSLKEEASAVATSAQMLVDAAKAQQPNKTMVQITGDGLKKAAANLAQVAPTIVVIAGQIVAAVLRMQGIP